MSETRHTPEPDGPCDICGDPDCGDWSISDADLAYLRRVEKAARAYVNADPDVSDTLALYDALEQAVGR